MEERAVMVEERAMIPGEKAVKEVVEAVERAALLFQRYPLSQLIVLHRQRSNR